jgi:ketosteroid isomerase-like protein
MSIIDAVNRWYNALNAHDTAAIADCFAPGGTYFDPSVPAPISNDEIAPMFEGFFEIYPDAQWETPILGAISDTLAVAEWRMTGTYKPKGRAVVSRGADFYTHDPDSDRLASVVGYFDVLSTLKQTRD